jgi:hypothetical protein
VNPAEQEELGKLRFSIRASGEQMDHLLDKLLAGQKLDYYSRGTILIIATRSWLWGPPAPSSADPAIQWRATGTRKARLEVLVDRIFARHVPDRLHPVGAEPGFVSEEALAFHRAAKDRAISISFFKPTPLSEIVARLSEFSETPVAIDPSLPAAIAGRKVTLAVEKGSVLDVLEALFVPLGAALSPEAGKLVVVPRR